MKCFNHRNVDAIAICKNCNKGLCPECAVDVGNGVACKGQCETEVEMINKVVEQSKKAFQINQKTSYQISLWMALLGFGLIISSLFLDSSLFMFTIFMGVLFLFGAAIYYFASKRYK